MKKFRVSTRVTRFSSVHGKWYAGFCYGAKSENFLSLGFVNCLLLVELGKSCFMNFAIFLKLACSISRSY